MRYPRRILILCILSGATILIYTVFMMNNYSMLPAKRWIQNTRSAVDIVYSTLPTRTNLGSQELVHPTIEVKKALIHTYGFSWIIGAFFFVPLFFTSLLPLRNYYTAVTLPSYPNSRPIIDHIAWKWGGVLGCWVGAAYGGELQNVSARALFASLFIPATFYFILALVASVLARFRFLRSKVHNPSSK